MQNRAELDELIHRCANGERKAQELLYRNLYASMFRICMRYATDIDEAGFIYNEAMLKVLTNISDYTGKGVFEGWVQRIIVNTGIDHLRKEARFKTIHQPGNDENEFLIDASVYADLGVDELQRMVSTLSVNTRLVFNMFAIEGFNHDEIAKQLGISAGTSRWHLNEARRLLIEKLNRINSLINSEKQV